MYSKYISIEGKKIETDSEGYLRYSNQWNEVVAEAIAEKEEIILSPEHWEVVHFIREFYLKFNSSPTVRMLVKAMANRFSNEKSNSRYLYHLFPRDPSKLANKIAGLPRPVSCI